MIILSSINFPTIICLPTFAIFSREATSEIYGAESLLYYICLHDLFLFAFIFRSILSKTKNYLVEFYLLLFADLLNQKYKNTLLQFILSHVPERSIYQIITTFSRPFANFRHRYPKGIDNPFNTLGCEYLLFVCRCRSRSVALMILSSCG